MISTFYLSVYRSCVLAGVHSGDICSGGRKSGGDFSHVLDYKSVLCPELFSPRENRSYIKKNIRTGVHPGGKLDVIELVFSCNDRITRHEHDWPCLWYHIIHPFQFIDFLTQKSKLSNSLTFWF